MLAGSTLYVLISMSLGDMLKQRQRIIWCLLDAIQNKSLIIQIQPKAPRRGSKTSLGEICLIFSTSPALLSLISSSLFWRLTQQYCLDFVFLEPLEMTFAIL